MNPFTEEAPVSLYEIPLKTLSGQSTSLADHKGKALLIVNVASKCGLTPQYSGLEKLHERLSARGFEVLGFPCNQFGGQEPGTAEEIATFCSVNYGVTFPMFEKLEVNGENRHPLYGALAHVADADGHSGDIRWNFEKFLVASDGRVLKRYSPVVTPDDATLVADIEAALPA